VKIHRATVMGVGIDQQTRCAHYHSDHDIVAIKFKCCGMWFSCHLCHAELSEHPVEVWPKKQFGERAIMCGNCGHELTISEYLQCRSVCPQCEHQFNPGCASHHHLYFEM
jgi:uncharacterized CHY-type Zn-finger protein